MLDERPIKDRYNDLLRERVALEGELALQRRRAEIELAAARARGNQWLLLLLLLPLFTLICRQKTDPSVFESQMAAFRDSLAKCQNEQIFLEKTRKQSVKYIIRQGDALTSIGSLFFNDRQAGYQIGKDNGILTDYQQHHLNLGDTLIINFR